MLRAVLAIACVVGIGSSEAKAREVYSFASWKSQLAFFGRSMLPENVSPILLEIREGDTFTTGRWEYSFDNDCGHATSNCTVDLAAYDGRLCTRIIWYRMCGTKTF